MSREYDLKKCPFCGSDARMTVVPRMMGFPSPSFYVRCTNIKNCGCKFEFFDSEGEAENAWNLRTDSGDTITVTRCHDCDWFRAYPCTDKDGFDGICGARGVKVTVDGYCNYGRKKKW